MARKPPLPKAQIIPVKGGAEAVEVLFNPADYTIEKTNAFQGHAVPGLASSIQQFVNGEARTLTMDLFFDTYTDGDRTNVTTYTDKVANLLAIDPKLHAPPVVRFAWSTIQFVAVIERLTQKYTMFLEDGTPVRATLTVTFREYATPSQQLRSPTRESTDRLKRRTIRAGTTDQLWRLAANEYDDATQWRPIADKNDIDNPRFLEPGRSLVLPPLE